jgi:hypothetical protein
MKATIEFNLPDDQNEYVRAVHAHTAWQTLYDLDSKLRNLIKYSDEFGNEDLTAEKLAEDLRREINEALIRIDE